MIVIKKINKFILVFLILLVPLKTIATEKLNFLSLKNSEVNLRQGPSFEYPIKLSYKKKHLPVLVLDKSDAWRKVKDFENNSGWIHVSQLTRKKSAINIKNHSLLYTKPTIYSKPIVKIEKGRLFLVQKCKLKWCKVTSGSFTGWVSKDFLWGFVN